MEEPHFVPASRYLLHPRLVLRFKTARCELRCTAWTRLDPTCRCEIGRGLGKSRRFCCGLLLCVVGLPSTAVLSFTKNLKTSRTIHTAMFVPHLPTRPADIYTVRITQHEAQTSLALSLRKLVIAAGGTFMISLMDGPGFMSVRVAVAEGTS